MNYNDRVLVSFDGLCEYACKHCYTQDMDQKLPKRTVDEIVDSIKEESFDIIYVSQKKENFIDPDEGLDLCEKLYERYQCSIMAITRNVFQPHQLERLVTLHNKMKNNKHELFIGVSVPALYSAYKTENLDLLPEPKQRLEFVKDLYNKGLNVILFLRPLFPDKIISLSEAFEIINLLDKQVSCVVSAGLVTNKHILDRLGLKACDFDYLPEGQSEYLKGAADLEFNYTDVEYELSQVHDYCLDKEIPFFRHSLPAINYLSSMKTA